MYPFSIALQSAAGHWVEPYNLTPLCWFELHIDEHVFVVWGTRKAPEGKAMNFVKVAPCLCQLRRELWNQWRCSKCIWLLVPQLYCQLKSWCVLICEGRRHDIRQSVESFERQRYELYEIAQVPSFSKFKVINPPKLVEVGRVVNRIFWI